MSGTEAQGDSSARAASLALYEQRLSRAKQLYLSLDLDEAEDHLE